MRVHLQVQAVQEDIHHESLSKLEIVTTVLQIQLTELEGEYRAVTYHVGLLEGESFLHEIGRMQATEFS